MHIVLAILLLVAGVAYPMASVVWLNQRMGRTPKLSSRQVGLLLALNGILPISLIFWALTLLSPRFAASLTVRMIAIVTGIAALAIVIFLALARAPVPTGGPPPEEAADGR